MFLNKIEIRSVGSENVFLFEFRQTYQKPIKIILSFACEAHNVSRNNICKHNYKLT